MPTLQEQVEDAQFSLPSKLFRLAYEGRYKVDLATAPERVAKSVTSTGIDTTSGMYRIEVEAPAKLVYPTDAPVENDAVLVTQEGGLGLTYVTVDGRQAGGTYVYSGGVKPGNRAASMSLTTNRKSGLFATIGMEIPWAKEAINAGKGTPNFDVQATGLEVMTSAFKELLEIQNIGGRTSVAAPAPVITAVGSATGGSIPAGTYNYGAVGLTLEGYFNAATTAGAMTVPTVQTITTANGRTYTQNGGTTALSAYVSQTLTGATSSVVGTVTSWPLGCVAIGWVSGVAGSERITAVTTTSTYTFTAVAPAGNQAVAGIITTALDYSVNQYGYDGLFTLIGNNSGVGGSTTLNVGGVLTTTNGRLDQLDQIMLNMYTGTASSNQPALNRLGPDVAYFNATDMLNMTKKLGSTGANNLIRWNIDLKSDDPSITAGMIIGYYTNTFTGKVCKLVTHPFCPQGTFFGYAKALPANYVMSGLTSPWKIVQNDPIHAIDWVETDRTVYRGMYTQRALIMEAPRACFMAYNITAG